MSRQILVIGHGSYPSGLCSSATLIIGKQENLHYLEIDSKNNHDVFTLKVEKFLADNSKVVVLADLTGGAPFQICAKIIKTKKYFDHFLVSGITLSFLLELCFLLHQEETKKINWATTLQNLLKKSQETSLIIYC